jgi:hypothetical protein
MLLALHSITPQHPASHQMVAVRQTRKSSGIIEGPLTAPFQTLAVFKLTES